MSERTEPAGPTESDPLADRVWCDDCRAYTAKVVHVDEYGDEVIHCPVCTRTWGHP